MGSVLRKQVHFKWLNECITEPKNFPQIQKIRLFYFFRIFQKMCSYTYKYKKHQLTGALCIYPSFYEEYLTEFTQTKYLPVDPEGYCIFHSRNNDWKVQNNFNAKFEELFKVMAEVCVKYNNPKWPFNFSGFYFFQDGIPLKLNNSPKNISLDFTFCEFSDRFIINGAYLKSIDLDSSYMHGTLEIRNTKFSGNLNCTQSKYDNGIVIINSSLEGYTYFDYCSFKNMSKKLDANFKFRDCTLDYINFENSNFETSVLFDKVVFRNEVVFNKSRFTDEFYFHYNEVNGAVSFKETSFLLAENSNPTYSTVGFKKLNINKNGKLLFKGKEPMESMVKGELQLDFEASPEGIISFENFNLNSIFLPAKLQLFELEKTGQVEIGKGCRKYYCQTGIFEISTDSQNQKLILDIVKVFCNYFEIHNHYNLGIEIVERKTDMIRYFFFTDETITQFEFESRIKQNEYDLWQTFANLSTYSGNELKGYLTEEKNALIDLAAIFLKIRSRIIAIDYKESDLNKLVNSIAVDGLSVIDKARLHLEIQNNFQSFYKELPPINIKQTKLEITMGDTFNNFRGDQVIQKGENNTYNKSFIENQTQSILKNCVIENEKKMQIISEVANLKKESDPVERESKFQRFMKDWGDIIGKTAGNAIKELIN